MPLDTRHWAIAMREQIPSFVMLREALLRALPVLVRKQGNRKEGEWEQLQGRSPGMSHPRRLIHQTTTWCKAKRQSAANKRLPYGSSKHKVMCINQLTNPHVLAPKITLFAAEALVSRKE
eukprot:1158225-Pelagomonas_calceolata.AAC.14